MSKLRHFHQIDERDLLVRTDGVEYFSSRELPESSISGWHQVVYASKGVITVTTPDGAWVVPPLRGVFVPSRTRCTLKLHGAVAMRSLFIRERILRNRKSCFVLNISPLLKELILHAVEKGQLRKSVGEEKRLVEVIVDQLKGVSVEPLRIPMPKDDRLKRAVDLFERSPALVSSLSQMSKFCGASQRTLERLIAKETGMSFGKWRQQLRMHQALRLLGERHPVTNVALEVGYSTPSAFVYSFRQAFGMTPSEYFSRGR